jgi:hypothetical protein
MGKIRKEMSRDKYIDQIKIKVHKKKYHVMEILALYMEGWKAAVNQ